MKGIADTGFLVAFINRGDKYHEWAVGLADQFTEPFLTCESVLSEMAFHTDSQYVFELLNLGLIALAFDCEKHLTQLEKLAESFADRKPDFADLCLIRMSELFPKHPVITIDREDFRVYRRNKREAIPLICPPE
jgi:uncharacterized protein